MFGSLKVVATCFKHLDMTEQWGRYMQHEGNSVWDKDAREHRWCAERRLPQHGFGA
jgi:hypothetical protein